MAKQTDFLVVGAGIAGMWFALEAAEHGRVTVLTKTRPRESNSAYAQGGIAAVWDDEDQLQFHVRDTLIAGAGLCRRDAVEQTVNEGPERVRELIRRGAEFTRRLDGSGEYSLHHEGGHSHRRILHAEDFTGQEIVRALNALLVAHPNIELLDHHMAVNVVTTHWLARRTGEIPPETNEAVGAYVLDLDSDEVEAIEAPVVVMATGGAGKVYLYTTNPPIATGDGHAMAWRAGAKIANMEFVQFHPTCLFHPMENSFLISEVLRGEGGKLVGPDDERFMDRYDERAELAPRDIVARAIDNELKTRGLECVYLDMRHLDRAQVEHAFPNIDSKLMSLGIDMTRDPIPVVPAAHYMCGGVLTTLNGESSLANLFAVGEVACTGLHGANRLASNSLLEALVFSHHAARVAVERLPGIQRNVTIPDWNANDVSSSDEMVVVKQTWEEIRRFMWNYVGIVRTYKRLKRAQRRLRLVREEVENYYWDYRLTGDLIELRNLVDCAEMIVTCALRRRESRGLHYTLDFPDLDDRSVRDTVIERWRV